MPIEESVREPRQPRVVEYGPLASMLDHLPAGAAPHAREALLRACTNTGIRVDDVIVGARSVVATHDPGLGPVIRDIMHDVLRHSESDYTSESTPAVEIAVRYDGIDLDDVARRCDMTTDSVIELHTKTEFVVEFCGFSPGFAYLAGLPSALELPRRATPRTRVPAGSVAIAAQYSAVYPRESPGGWHLLGTTDHLLWDEHRRPPATLQPGTRIRFVVAS